MSSGGGSLHPRVMVLFFSLHGEFLFVINPFSTFSLNYNFVCTVLYKPLYSSQKNCFLCKCYSIEADKNPQFKIHINVWLKGFI